MWQFFDDKRRGAADGSSWESGDAAAQRRALDRQQQPQQQHVPYPRGRGDAASRPEVGTAGAAAVSGGYRKETGPPSIHRWDSGRSNWRPDHPREGKADLAGRRGSREAVGAAAGRGIADEIGREARPARPRGGDVPANGGLRSPRSGSAGERRSGENGGRARLAWDGSDEPRGAGPLRAAAAAAAVDGATSVSRAHSRHYGDRRMGEGGAGGGRGGMDGGGASHGGWSDRKRSMESFGGQEGPRGSPKKVMLHHAAG